MSFRYLMTALFATVFAVGLSGQSKAVTVTWQNETFTGISGAANNNNFDTGQITFTGFQADTLSDIFGSGVYHTHGHSRTFGIDIILNGVLTNIFSDTVVGNNANHSLDLISTPISFALGTVTGIRLSTSGPVNQGWHLLFNTNGTTGNTTNFVFETNGVAAVPLPAALPLFLAALGGLGLMSRRRKVA